MSETSDMHWGEGPGRGMRAVRPGEPSAVRPAWRALIRQRSALPPSPPRGEGREHPRAKPRPQACLRAPRNTGLAERREARRVASASVEPGSGADEASSARPVALRLRRF